jgi:hypothetical protein
MIDGIIDAVCRFGEKLAVIMEGEGTRDTRMDGSRGERQSVIRKRVGGRSTCMSICMIVDLQTPMAEGAVQQFTLPYSIGGRVSKIIHVYSAIAHITDFVLGFICPSVESLASFFSFVPSCSLQCPLFRLSTYPMQA